jgi:hypothetical protein
VTVLELADKRSNFAAYFPAIEILKRKLTQFWISCNDCGVSLQYHDECYGIRDASYSIQSGKHRILSSRQYHYVQSILHNVPGQTEIGPDKSNYDQITKKTGCKLDILR